MDAAVLYNPASNQTVAAEAENAALSSFLARFEGRGLARAAKREQEKIDASKDGVSLLADGTLSGDSFCQETYQGRPVMSADDFAAYFEATRARNHDAAALASVVCCERTADARLGTPARTRAQSRLVGTNAGRVRSLVRVEGEATSSTRRGLVARTMDFCHTMMADDTVDNRVKGKKKALPVSMLASFCVITLCLMMIISASVMVAGAQNEVSVLMDEVSALREEATLMENRLESDTDYLEIYRVATEEYGMIDATFVDAVYLPDSTANTVEAYEEEDEVRFGLATLLAAIGIDIGS